MYADADAAESRMREYYFFSPSSFSRECRAVKSCCDLALRSVSRRIFLDFSSYRLSESGSRFEIHAVVSQRVSESISWNLRVKSGSRKKIYRISGHARRKLISVKVEAVVKVKKAIKV